MVLRDKWSERTLIAGLDSSAALAVMKHLIGLTKWGLTIAASIHQPSQDIFETFDRILIMSEGYQVYLAPPAYTQHWFSNVLGLPYDVDIDGTVADWVISLVSVTFFKSKEAAGRQSTPPSQDLAKSFRFLIKIFSTSQPGTWLWRFPCFEIDIFNQCMSHKLVLDPKRNLGQVNPWRSPIHLQKGSTNEWKHISILSRVCRIDLKKSLYKACHTLLPLQFQECVRQRMTLGLTTSLLQVICL